MRLLMMVLLAALATPVARAQAQAQTYPDKPVRVINPFSAGSASDTVARAVAQVMSTRLGQPVVVENKPGAGGTIGAGLVAKAAPDGYTLLVHSSAHTVNPWIYSNLPYDSAKNFAGISLLVRLPNILVAAPSKGWKTAADLVKAAKTQPGKLTYASSGAGSATHMNAEKFRASAGIDAVHVPYKGTPEATTDTMTGRVDYYFVPVINGLSLIRDNRLTPLAAGSATRASVLPDIPTTEELGYQGSAYTFWIGMMAPAGTPPAIIDRLNKEVAAALASPEVKNRLAALGADPSPSSAADLDKTIAREVKENAQLVKQAGIKVQ